MLAYVAISFSLSSLTIADEIQEFPKIKSIQEESISEEYSNILIADSIFGRNSYNDAYYLQRIQNDGYYHLVAFSDIGDIVQLHDASKWEIERSGRQKVLYWVQSDDIWIKPCISWFSGYNYVLYNRTTNQAVEANLIYPPLPMGANTFRITNIQPYERLILLSDDTVWQIAPDANFAKMRIGQRILVGVNNNWRTEKYPHIFINVDLQGVSYSLVSFYGYPVE